MSDADDKEAAFDELVATMQPNSEPELTAAEMERIVDNNQRAQRWATSLNLTVNKVVMPTVRNGHVYRVIQGGTTGTTEPTWPTGDDDTVVDGTVTFIEAGADFGSAYDLRAAKREAAILKREKSAELHEGGENKLFEQWDRIAKSYESVLIA